MLTGMRTLEQAGAEAIVIACNTAHAWYEQLSASTLVPVLHMAQAVIDAASRQVGPVALMATVGTLQAGIYQRYFEGPDGKALVPPAQDQAMIIDAIAAVKRWETQERERVSIVPQPACALWVRAVCSSPVRSLRFAAKGSVHEAFCLDATACLAQACVAFSCGADVSLEAAEHSDAAWRGCLLISPRPASFSLHADLHVSRPLSA